MTNLEATINQIRSKAANSKSKFISYAAELDRGLLVRQYQEIRSKAPRRHLNDRKYLFERTGIPSSGERSNRIEEHLAIALFRSFHAPVAMHLSDGRRLEILDYQVPLKAVQSDAGIGKVDMLGLIDGERLAVLELKVKGGDTPIAATLEALVYAAILEANLEDIGQELANKGYGRPKAKRPDIIVLGPADYWQEFDEYDEAWLRKLTPSLDDIAQALSTKIQFIELETGHFEMGFRGAPPKLDGDIRNRSLFCSKAPLEPFHHI